MREEAYLCPDVLAPADLGYAAGMDFTDLRVMAAATEEGERFCAVWTVRGTTVTTSEGEIRTGPGLDLGRNSLLERLDACALQSETELRSKLLRLGLTADVVTQKFEFARAWLTTIVVSEKPAQST
jgi:hypothetical protein